MAGNGVNIIINATDNASSSIKNILGAMAGFSLATLGIQGLQNAFQSLSEKLVSYNANMEQTQMGFATMLGDKGAGKEFIAQMQEFASRTPFEFSDVDQASKKLMAFGFSAKDIIPTLTAIGDASSALGLKKEGIDRITLALGQMSIKAHLSGEEVRQLNEAGIGAQKYLADAFNLTGKSFDNLAKTGISGSQAVKAIINGMANDPKFKGMMEQQSKTMNGMWSTVKDNTAIIFGEIGTNAFNLCKNMVKYFADLSVAIMDAFKLGGINAVLDQVFGKEWSERIWKASYVFSDFISVAVGLCGALFTGFTPILGVIIDIATSLADTVTSNLVTLCNFAKENLPIFKACLDGVVASYIAMNYAQIASIASSIVARIETIALTLAYVAEAVAIGEVAIALDLLMGPVGWAILAIGALTAVVSYFSSSQNVDKHVNASNMYADGYTQIGNEADIATGKIWRLTNEQARYFNEQNRIGGAYEDTTTRKNASDKDVAKSKIFNSVPITPIPAGAGGSAHHGRTDHSAEKLQKIWQEAQDKILVLENKYDEWQIKLQKSKEEYSSRKKDGLDEETNWKLYSLEEAKINEEHLKAREKLSNDLKKYSLSEYDYNVLLLNQENKDKQELYRNDTESRAIWDKTYIEKKKELDIKHTDEIKSMQLDLSKLTLSDYQYQLAELEKTNSEKQELYRFDIESRLIWERTYDEKKKEIENNRANDLRSISNEIKKSYLTDRQYQVLELEQQKLDTQKKYANDKVYLDSWMIYYQDKMKNLNPATFGDAFQVGLKESLRAMGDWQSNMIEVGNATAKALQSSLKTFFTDAMKGELKSFADYVGSFLSAVSDAIANMMANAMAQKIVSWVFPNIKFNANGGSLLANTPHVVGEHGAEMFIPDTNGTMATAQQTKNMLGGGNPNLKVNIINNTSAKIEENDIKYDFNFEESVLTIVLNARQTNRLGFNDALGI